MKAQVADDSRSVFDAKTSDEAKRHIELLRKKYEKSAPKLSTWAETALPEGLTVLALPTGHRRRLRTTNALERVNKEIKRRTRVATLFPNEASCLRLVTAVIMEISDEWTLVKSTCPWMELNRWSQRVNWKLQTNCCFIAKFSLPLQTFYFLYS